MSHRHRSFLVVTLVCACLAPVAAQRFAGRVLEVTDGDTVIVARGRGQVAVRLFGIDAPEGTQPYGTESTAALSRLVMGKVIDVDMKDVDLAAPGGSRPAFAGRCIPPDCVAPPSNTPGILGRRALSAGRIAPLGATADFHHGLLWPAGGDGVGGRRGRE